MTPNDEVLNSWKEVASYLGRGVRTVQRWEQELALPVRRPRGKSRSAVIAFKSELDQWLHKAPAEQLVEQHKPAAAVRPPRAKIQAPSRLHENTELLISRTHLLLARSSSLCDHLKILQQSVDRTVKLTAHKIENKEKNQGAVNPEAVVVPPPEKKGKVTTVSANPASKSHVIAS
jgi:hypothetical protein